MARTIAATGKKMLHQPCKIECLPTACAIQCRSGLPKIPRTAALSKGANVISNSSKPRSRSEEHTSELQSHSDLVCRLLLEKKKTKKKPNRTNQRKNNRNHTRHDTRSKR